MVLYHYILFQNVIQIFASRKHNKITGFALKQLEKQFPKSMKGLKNFYNWTTNADEEFTLLAKIMKSF